MTVKGEKTNRNYECQMHVDDQYIFGTGYDDGGEYEISGDVKGIDFQYTQQYAELTWVFSGKIKDNGKMMDGTMSV